MSAPLYEGSRRDGNVPFSPTFIGASGMILKRFEN